MFKPLLVAAVAIPLLHAAHLAEPAYQASNIRISTDYQADKLACASVAAALARDVCFEQARARKKVARAELEHSNSGTARGQQKVLEVRAEATYAVARKRCNGMKGDVKDLCIEQAQAAEAIALADAGRAPLVAAPRPEGVRVQRAVIDPYKPVVVPFKAGTL